MTRVNALCLEYSYITQRTEESPVSLGGTAVYYKLHCFFPKSGSYLIRADTTQVTAQQAITHIKNVR